MNCWVVSPNVSNRKEEEGSWKSAILKYEVAIMGWDEDNRLGRVFIDEVKEGDIILVAQGANWQKRLFLAGRVTTPAADQHLPDTPRAAWQRKLTGCLKDKELKALKLDFKGSAYGDASRLPAIYLLKPAQNPKDKSIVTQLTEAINKKIEMEKLENIITLLRYKKQIILQGPPGTGKTRMAKELASALIDPQEVKTSKPEISDEDIVQTLKGISKITTVAGNVEYEIIKVDSLAKSVILKKSTDTEANTSFFKIKEFYKGKFWRTTFASNDDRRAAALAKFIYENQNEPIGLEASGQLKLIQFHPSYSYEDFVRGIVSSPNEEGNGILYEAENKLLAEFAELAHKNYQLSVASDKNNISDLNIDVLFDEFVSIIEERLIEQNHKVALSPKLKLHITGIKKDAFHIASEDWKGDDLKFSQIKKLYNYNIKHKNELSNHADIAKTVYHRTSYYFPMLEMFREFISQHGMPFTTPHSVPAKNYILIIDEINRANLSSVLGELIYALEYRGEKVESMYEVDGNNTLILPPNLYIIGTMNTADRSVGHIDYAIRRRFAFVDIHPKVLEEDFETNLFKKVSELFVKDIAAKELEPSDHLSSEFQAKDVWLGHSYFIKKKEVDSRIRLQFEIIPILEEYIKDGVLKDSRELRTIIGSLEMEIA